MGAAVSAAGSLLGGLAAQAIMGKPTTYGPDTSIPGVTSATIKKGGKGQPDEKVPQVDVTQSLKWFQEAADLQTEYYNEGLNYYRDSLKAAAFEVNEGYKKANNTLKPLSYSSNQALNEQMKMMGLTPLSMTHDAYDQAIASGVPPDVAKRVAQAEKIEDSSERMRAKSLIMNDLNAMVEANNKRSAGFGMNIERQAAPLSMTGRGQSIPIDNESWLSGLMTSMYADSVQLTPEESKRMADAGIEGYEFMTDNVDMFSHKQLAGYDAKMKAYSDLQVKDWKEAQATYKGKADALSGFASYYDTTYTDDFERGYTGAEVEARVASTPGYQFQLDQGTKAIERQGAAAGMLGSGNTLTALTNYGQGLAQNFYGLYMDNLSRIVNQGSGATQQIAQNQVNQGKDYGALIEAGGSAMNQTAQLVGNAQAESKYRAGQLYADAAQFNASMQYSGIQAGLKRQTDVQIAAMNNQAPNQMANIAQQRFNYGVFQNQQGGAAYAANV